MNTKLAYGITIAVTALFALFFIHPVLSVIGEAFYSEEDGFTLAYIGAVFQNEVYVEGLWNALMLGIASTLASLVLAFPLALIGHRFDFPWKRTLGALILIPLVLPPFVGAVGVKHILGVEGSLNAMLIDWGLMSAAQPMDWLGKGRFWGVVAMNALHLYPILYMNVAAALSQLDPAMEQAAENLGCPPWKRLLKITLPLCMPGIFAGGAIVFIWSFTELGVPLVFDYSRVAPVQIYDGIKDLNSNPVPYALVAVMLIVSGAIFWISKRLLNRSEHGATPRPKGRAQAQPAPGLKGWLCTLVYASVVVIACLPHVGVVLLSLSHGWYGTILPEAMGLHHFEEALGHPLVVPSIQNSLFYALCATAVDVVLGLAIAWVVVRSSARGRSLLDTLVMLPLAVPGLVLAFGYLALSQSGRSLHFLTGDSMSPVYLLIAAYAVRRLPYVVRAAVAGLQQSNPALEEAAQSMGASPLRTLRRISIPLIGASVTAGAILAFAFAMLEVSDSLILAQEAQHFPITKAIYALLSTLGNGPELAAALGVWAMVFLGIALIGAVVLGGKKGGLFRM